MTSRALGPRATAALVGLITLPFFCAAISHARDATSQPMLGGEAPAFSLPTVSGGTMSLDDLKGRFVVLHFGASW